MLNLIAQLMKSVVLLISYISNANSFPKPLSTQEEAEYLERYKNGDMEARNILIERNLRLVAHISKKYLSAIKDTEDLISIGTIGLMKAITTFNNSKGTRLATYAARCIENVIVTSWKQILMLKIYSQNCVKYAILR